jgi:hypothetical protein
MAGVPYRPVTKVTTIQVAFLNLVTRADPNWAKDKFWEIEYEFTGKNYYANPYIRGAFNTPAKTVNVNYAGPATFAAGDLTGVGFDFVTVQSNNPTPGLLTTRTAAQMFGDIANAGPGVDWYLRIQNFGGTSHLTLNPGAGVSLVGSEGKIRRGFMTDYVVTLVTPTSAVIQTMISNVPINSVSP